MRGAKIKLPILMMMIAERTLMVTVPGAPPAKRENSLHSPQRKGALSEESTRSLSWWSLQARPENVLS
jgi:hypothetical protein